MASIAVVATRQGHYRGRIYEPGEKFILIDQKDEKGEVLQSADQAFADADKNRSYGWMRKIKGDPAAIAIEEQTEELNRKKAALLKDQMGTPPEVPQAVRVNDQAVI